MRVAIVDGDISYPPTSGKRLRTLNLMLRLAQRHRVTYIARGEASLGEMVQAETFLRDHGIQPLLLAHPVAKKSGPLFYARLAKNLLSKLPYSVASHQSTIMRDVVSRFAQGNSIDLWQFEWSAYLDSLSENVRAPRLLIAHNVDTLIWQRYYENARGLARRWFLHQQWKKFAAFEKHAFQQVQRVVAVSEDDADLIRSKFGMPLVDVVENGIDRSFFEEVQPENDPRRILFLGALDWRPNLDALDQLLTRIFPAVLKQEPQARLIVVGRQPAPALVDRLKQARNVELHANVIDVRPFLAGSGVLAVPLRIGGGSRLKILEALACGLPVVSTQVGAEGLCLEPGRDYVETEDAAMADALVRAIREPQAHQAMARRAREKVLERYDWDVLARKLEFAWERCRDTFRQLSGKDPLAATWPSIGDGGATHF